MISCQSAQTGLETASYLACPDDEENCAILAKRVNKQFNGSKYRLITNPQLFVGEYKSKIKKAQNSTDPDECALASSCNYDVDKIHGPIIKEGKLVFFVHSNSKDFPTPHKITCDNPNRLQSANITQECLPYVK